jgi:hypothetical protein
VAAVARVVVRPSKSRGSRRESLLVFVIMTVLISMGLTGPSYRCFVETVVSRIVARAAGTREILQRNMPLDDEWRGQGGEEDDDEVAKGYAA